MNYSYHFQPLVYYKKCARLKEVIRRNFDQCEVPIYAIISTYANVKVNTKVSYPMSDLATDLLFMGLAGPTMYNVSMRNKKI